jgi:hypothetical protein
MQGNVATTAQEKLLEDGGMYGNAKERKEKNKEKDQEQAKVALVCKGGGGVQAGRGGDGVVAIGVRWGGMAGGSLLGGHLRQVEVLPKP